MDSSPPAVMRLSHAAFAVLTSLATACAVAAEGRGLTVNSERVAWPHWQARLQVATEPTALALTRFDSAMLRPRSVALFGDYYMARPYFGASGGLRLTSGILMGPRSDVFGPGQAAMPAVFSVSSIGRSPSFGWASSDTHAEATLALPYLGIGYSDASLRSGLSFSADLGLAVPGPIMLRAARSLGSLSLEDMVRELRLTPVLQFGVSYRF